MFQKLFTIILILANFCTLAMEVGEKEEGKGVKRNYESEETSSQTEAKKPRIIPEGLAIDLERPEAFLSEQDKRAIELAEQSRDASLNEAFLLNKILDDSEKKDLNEKEEKPSSVEQEEERSISLAKTIQKRFPGRAPVDQEFFLKKKLEIIEAVCDSKINDFKRGHLSFNDLIKIIRTEINRVKVGGGVTFHSLILNQNFIDPFMDFLSNKLEIHQFELAVLLDTKLTTQYLDSNLVSAEQAICASVFLLAIRYMRFEICQLLLAKGIALSEKYFSEELLEAISNKNSDEVAFLLRIGANPNSVSLHDAVLYGNREIVQMLLDAGVDVNQVRDNMTPLKFLISNTDLMIKSQADINRFWGIFNLLLSRGAKRDSI